MLTVFVFAAVAAVAAAPPDSSPAPVLDNCIVSLIHEARVPAEVAGVLVSLDVKEGAAVAKGQLIAQIDDTDAQLQKKAAELKLQVAQEDATNDINVRYAERAAEVADAELAAAKAVIARQPDAIAETQMRTLDLSAKKARLSIEVAQLEFKKAGLNAQVAEADVDAAKEEIQRRRIEAPLEGVVEQVMKHLGEWANPGEPVCRIVRMDRLRVEGYLSAADYAPAQVDGRPVVVEVLLPDGPRRFSGKIEFVSNLIQAGGEYRVFAEVDNQKEKEHWLLRPGATVRMAIGLAGQQPPTRPSDL